MRSACLLHNVSSHVIGGRAVPLAMQTCMHALHLLKRDGALDLYP